MEQTLYHHGIKGQKWGDRNGPPYPLGQSAHRAVVKRAQKSDSKVGSSEEKHTPKEKKHLTEGQKRAIIIGAAAVGTALVAVGGYKLYKTGALQTIGRKASRGLSPSDKFGSLGEIGGFKLQTQKLSTRENLYAINKRDLDLGLPNRFDKCGACTVATEMRYRTPPFDVIAKDINGMSFNDVLACFKGAIGENVVVKQQPGENAADFRKRGYRTLVKELGEYGAGEPCRGAIGVLAFDDDGAPLKHVFNWESMADGRVKFMDGKYAVEHDVLEKMFLERIDPSKILYARLDDCEINFENAARIVKNRL